MITRYNYLQKKLFVNQFNHSISSRSRFFSTGKHMYSHGTYLTVPSHTRILRCSMHLAKHVVKNHIIPGSKSVLGTTTRKVLSRGMASIHGGRWNKQGLPLRTSKGTLPESDLTGKHKLAFVGRCVKKGCKDQNCATGTQLSTGNPQPNPCGEPAQYHTQPPAPHSVITYELAGNTTSTIPSNKNGVTLDAQEQMNGAKKSQELVTEQNTVLISATAIKGDSKATAYLQRDDRTEAVLKAMPSDSSIK